MPMAGSKSQGLERVKEHSGVSIAFLVDAFVAGFHAHRPLGRVATHRNETDLLTQAMKTNQTSWKHAIALGIVARADYKRNLYDLKPPPG